MADKYRGSVIPPYTTPILHLISHTTPTEDNNDNKQEAIKISKSKVLDFFCNQEEIAYLPNSLYKQWKGRLDNSGKKLEDDKQQLTDCCMKEETVSNN